jgi:NAD(P)-dependent dehydrogenase (short-subunit alcohol dehydrogenase family)
MRYVGPMMDDHPAGDTFSLDGAVAVITGATRGIGRVTAEVLGRAGAHVVVVGRSTRERPHRFSPGTMEDVTADLATAGIEVLGVPADLADPEQVATIVDRTLEWRGRCDVLVNNAAYTSNGSVLDIPARRWQTGFQVQVTTPLQLCQAFVPGMLERRRGRVVNVSSGASQALLEGLSLYSVTKLAMERWTEFMQLELGGRGVSFNTLRIDQLVPTAGWRLTLEQQGEDVATGGRGLSEFVSPEECAAFIAWMIAQPASWSGQTVGFHDLRALQGATRTP